MASFKSQSESWCDPACGVALLSCGLTQSKTVCGLKEV